MGLSPATIALIEAGSAAVDSPFNQAPSASYMHAMRAPGQSIADARALACNFVNRKMNDYQSDLSNGNADAAWKALGAALHTVMDSTSPSHAGFQVWDPEGDPGGSFRNHGDNSPEDLAHLTPALLAQTLQLMQNAMSGKSCFCSQ